MGVMVDELYSGILVIAFFILLFSRSIISFSLAPETYAPSLELNLESLSYSILELTVVSMK